MLGYVPVKPKHHIQLFDQFVLPEDRPRTLKRVPHIVHYPPVVKYLFESAYDEGAGAIREARFTFADVQKAIEATGVNLSWTRADTFVSEIARSRNVRQILSLCLSKGYSIRAISEGSFIGEFVSIGESGTVDDKEIIYVRSREVAYAIPLAPSVPIDPLKIDTLPALLLQAPVAASIWSRNTVVKLERPARVNGNGLLADYAIGTKKGTIASGCLIVSALRNLPTRVIISRLAQEAQADEVVVLVPITAAQVCQKLAISEQTLHRWRNQYGGLKADEAKRLRELETENARLRRLVAELALDKQMLQEVAQKKW